MVTFFSSIVLYVVSIFIVATQIIALNVHSFVDNTVALVYTSVMPTPIAYEIVPLSKEDVVSLSSSTEEEVKLALETPTSKNIPALPTKKSSGLEERISDVSAEISKLTEIIKKQQQQDTQKFQKNISSSLVNFYCTTKSTRGTHIITASGIIIDAKGIVLTNAHVAQYMLLGNLSDCRVRAGSPAGTAYTTKLLYISPEWIRENKTAITDEHPTGTGEFDYALLLITGRVGSNEAVPKEFPALSIELPTSLKLNDDVQLAGYPASFLGGQAIYRDLYLVTTFAKVKELFTFKEKSLDLFSMTGSITAQKGSSGGAVVNGNGNLVGLIVTATEEKTTDERQVRAITLSHINDSIDPTFSGSLKELLSGNVEEKANLFRTKFAPPLTNILIDQILEESS